MWDVKGHEALQEMFQGDRAPEQLRLPFGEDNVPSLLFKLAFDKVCSKILFQHPQAHQSLPWHLRSDCTFQAMAP